jgi:hypothetical protein
MTSLATLTSLARPMARAEGAHGLLQPRHAVDIGDFFAVGAVEAEHAEPVHVGDLVLDARGPKLVG